MPWGISETAPEKEKIKSEFADFLNGLNACWKISYYVYSEIFDESHRLFDKIYSQGVLDAQKSTATGEDE